MLTEKDYCDYDICVALKELGYPIDWFEDETYHENSTNIQLYEAQKWLREEKGVIVLVHHLMTEEGDWEWEISYRYRSKGMYHSYEEALSEGVRVAVKILKEELNEET